MENQRRRLRLFVHASSQGRYLALSVFPVVLMTLLCGIFIFGSVEQLLMNSNERPMVPVAKVQRSANYIAHSDMSGASADRVAALNTELQDVQRTLEAGHRETLVRWNRIKISIYLALFVGLFASTTLTLIYSHRTVGPLIRIRNNITDMAEGRQIPPVRLRKHDEFKDLAASLEQLRQRLTDLDQLH